jgi:tetratricopeptide (TPR) repeat protein
MKHTGYLAAVGVLSLALSIAPQVRGDEAEERQLLEQAGRLARDGKMVEALDTVKKVIQLSPKNDQYLAMASDLERRVGRFEDGLEHARAAIKINDKIGLYYGLAAVNAYGTQDPELALEYCRKVLGQKPEDVGPSVYNDMKLYESMLIPKTYTITWNLDPQKGVANGDFYSVAVPKGDLPYQSVSVQVKGARSSKVVKGDVNDVVRVVPQGKSPFQVITTVTVRPVSFKKKLQNPSAGPPPRDAAAWLGPSETFDPASPKLRKLGKELKGKNAVETVHNVHAWVSKNIGYKLQEKSVAKFDFKNVEEVLARGHGECKGHAALVAALCRAAGVPARTVWGIYFHPDAKGAFDSHNWVEVHIPGSGWVPVDPRKSDSFGWLPTSHVRVFMDLRPSDRSPDCIPLANLLYMNGEKLKYEESYPTKSPGEK